MSSPKSSHKTSSSQAKSVYQSETGEIYLRRKLKELCSSDRPQHNCDGRGTGGRLLPTYDTFEFQLTAASRDEIKDLWERNCKGFEDWKGQRRRPKESACIGLFIGAPGVGKTRTLLELKTILPCGENYVYVSFNGTTPFAPKEKYANFDQMVAIRILWGSFEHWNSRFPFKQWAAKFDYEKDFTTTDCLEIIRKEEGPFCLAIDEVSKLNEMAQRACDEITETVLTSHIVVFLGGTLRNDWEEALTRSSIPSRFLSLAPLSSAQVSNILDTLQPRYAKYFNGWRTNTHLRDLLLQIGGVPRLLDDFVDACDKEFNGGLPPWDWEQMDASLLKIDRKTAVALDTDTLTQLVKDIIQRKQVNRMDLVLEEASKESRRTYDRLQSRGFIQLLKGDSEDDFFIFVPFMRFRRWVNLLVVSAKRKAPFRVLQNLMTRKVQWGFWKDFESITAQYFQLLISMWSEEAKQEPPKLATWEEFFTTSIPGWCNDNYIQFIDGSPNLVTCHKRFPTYGSTIQEPHDHDKYKFDNGSVFINGDGAPFADVFFTCRHGKEGTEGTKCLVGIQCKLLGKTKMTRKILNEELDKNADAMKKYKNALGDCSEMLTVVLVTAPFTDRGSNQGESNQGESNVRMARKRAKESNEPKDDKKHIVFDRRLLQRFFPQPLRDYTFRAISSGRVNINCSPFDDIKKVFGLTEKQVKEFVKERKSSGGFTKTADLPFDVTIDQLPLIEF